MWGNIVMRICISGDVAVGKTTIAKALAERLSLPLISLKDFVEKERLSEGRDEEFDAAIVDVEKLREALEEKLPQDCVVEGHLLVEFKLSNAVLILVKGGAKTLYERMKARGYSEKKIEENLIAHHLDYFEESAKDVWGSYIVVENKDSVDAAVEKILNALNV